jgi:hypothetical protein
MNTLAVLLNNAGAGIEATVNKAVAGNDAAFAFKTGFSARALIGLLGNDDFSFKVSPDGSAFFDALKIDRTNGQVELPQPTILPGLSAAPSPPPTGKVAVYARNRAGAPWIDVMRPSGRDFPLQPHFGVNRIANWSPSVTTTITTEGLATGLERRHRRADADRHGGEFRHRDGWGADPVHRGTAQWQLGLGADGRRGFGRGVRAGDHRGPASEHAVPVAAAVYE